MTAREVVVAALAAAAIGQVFDGALLIVIFATSGALEAFVTRRTADSVRALLDLAPERATRLDGAGGEEIVDTAELAVGDISEIAIGFFAAFVVALLVVRWVLRHISRMGFQPFGWYRIALGLVMLALLSLR